MIEVNDLIIEEAFADAPRPAVISDGQLTLADRSIYFWAAKAFFKGEGTIVDAGALVGGSTTVLCEGIRCNPKISQHARPTVHVYDLFDDDRDGYSANLLRGWYNEEADSSDTYDFEKHFRRNTAAYSDYIVVHKGDITKQNYDDHRFIEVLSIDVAKNEDLMLFCAELFFPKLVPGKSVILHQDYIFAYQPWLHIAMELMSDIVEKVYDATDQCTAVFVPKRVITIDDVRQRLGTKGSDYYHIGNAHLISAAISRARDGHGKFVHSAALPYFYLMMGDKEKAAQLALKLFSDFEVTDAMIESSGLRPFLIGDLHFQLTADEAGRLSAGMRKHREERVLPFTFRALLLRLRRFVWP